MCSLGSFAPKCCRSFLVNRKRRCGHLDRHAVERSLWPSALGPKFRCPLYRAKTVNGEDRPKFARILAAPRWPGGFGSSLVGESWPLPTTSASISPGLWGGRSDGRVEAREREAVLSGPSGAKPLLSCDPAP